MPKAGEIWLADIPFTSGGASKLRPVLVLWEDAADVVVAAVTKARRVLQRISPCETGQRRDWLWRPRFVFLGSIAWKRCSCVADLGGSLKAMPNLSEPPGRSTWSCDFDLRSIAIAPNRAGGIRRSTSSKTNQQFH